MRYEPRMLGWKGMAYCAVLVLLLGGCATNSALTLIDASKTTKPELPSDSVVENELAGHAFTLGHVYPNLVKDDPQERLNVSIASIATLFEHSVRQAFEAAKLGNGNMPAYTIDFAIIDVKLRQGITLLPNTFLVRMEIFSADQSRVMSAEFQSRYLRTIPIILPGLVGALPGYNSALIALSQMLPATAVVVTKTAAGLQQGKTLDKIEVYPSTRGAGGLIYPPSLFLKGHPYGIYPLSKAALENVAQQINVQP